MLQLHLSAKQFYYLLRCGLYKGLTVHYFNSHRSLGDAMVILTHWGRVTHIYVSKLTIIGSNNGLSPDRRQAIIWTNAGMLLIGPLGTNFSEILIEILTFSFTKMCLKLSSVKWRPFCPGLNVLKVYSPNTCYGLSSWALLVKLLSGEWMSWNPFDDKSTMFQVMVRCWLVTNH